VEAKGPSGRASPAQRAFRGRIATLGGVAVVIDDVADLAGLMKRLEQDPWLTIS
jgi:hypothetical protein